METEKSNSTEEQEHEQEQELKGLQDEDDYEDEERWEGEMRRRRISSHPLYGLLVETHLNCLKVGGMVELDRGYSATDLNQQQDNRIRCLNTINPSELDRFMEAYCFALGKLKDAMEESQLKSMAFVNSMYSQLRELTATGATAKKPTTSSSTSNDTN